MLYTLCVSVTCYTVIYTQLPGVKMYLLPEDTLLEMQFPEVSDINYPEPALSCCSRVPNRNTMTILYAYLVKAHLPAATNVTKYTIPGYNLIPHTNFYLYFRMWPSALMLLSVTKWILKYLRQDWMWKHILTVIKGPILSKLKLL